MLINTNLEDTLTVIGADVTAAITRQYNGAIRDLEKCLMRPLQWSVCLLMPISCLSDMCFQHWMEKPMVLIYFRAQ